MELLNYIVMLYVWGAMITVIAHILNPMMFKPELTWKDVVFFPYYWGLGLVYYCRGMVIVAVLNIFVRCDTCGKKVGVYIPENVLRSAWEGWEFTLFGNYCPSCKCKESSFVVVKREEGEVDG